MTSSFDFKSAFRHAICAADHVTEVELLGVRAALVALPAGEARKVAAEGQSLESCGFSPARSALRSRLEDELARVASSRSPVLPKRAALIALVVFVAADIESIGTYCMELSHALSSSNLLAEALESGDVDPAVRELARRILRRSLKLGERNEETQILNVLGAALEKVERGDESPVECLDRSGKGQRTARRKKRAPLVTRPTLKLGKPIERRGHRYRAAIVNNGKADRRTIPEKQATAILVARRGGKPEKHAMTKARKWALTNLGTLDVVNGIDVTE